MPHVAYIGLGSNLGERRTFLLEATLAMAQLGQLQACSSVYQTPPWGDPFQPAYYNAAVCLHTELHPQALLTALLTIESIHGRKRNQERPCGPRTLDLDILMLGAEGQEVLTLASLVVPHPRLHLRAFALRPLLDIAASLTHPVLGRSLVQLYADLPASERDSLEALGPL